MRHHLRRLIITGILIAIGVALGWYWSQPEPVTVRVAPVARGAVESTVANTRAGSVKACRRTHLSLAIGGTIDKLPVKRGEQVVQGQLLLALWNRDLAAQLLAARRELDATHARTEQACVVAQVARREAERLVRLRKKNLAAEEDTERAVGNAEAQEAACGAARESIRVSEARVVVARENLGRTILRAPFAGTVAEINGELGEFLTPSPPGIATAPAIDLIDNSCLYVSAPIDEVDAAAVKQDMIVRISLDAFPGRHFTGHVRRVAPYVREVEKQARTVDVEVDFDTPAEYRQLLPGYSADLEIVLATHVDVLRIPTEALLEGKRVLVFDAGDSRLHARKVATGISNWKLTEVVAGLQAGERIVVSVDRQGVEAEALAEVE